MSTRSGEFVTLKKLIDEVGVDAVRYFFLERRSDQTLEFDIELAKKKIKIILFTTFNMLMLESAA